MCRLIILAAILSTIATAQPLRVHLDWIPDAEFAGIFVAIEKGWYKEAGIEIELVPDGLDSMPTMPEGQPDVGIHSGQDLIRAVDKGAALKAFAANYQASPICLVVGQDAGIHGVKDLKGKTIGIFAPTDYDTLRIMLGNNGLKIDDVKIKQLKTIDEVELVKMLRDHKVDAFTAWEFNWTLTFPLLGYKVRVFPGYDNGLHFYGIVYFARSEALVKHHDLLARFLKTTIRGWREVFRDVPAAAKIITDKYYPAERYVSNSKALTLKQQIMELKLARRFFFEGVDRDRIGWMSNWKWTRSLDISRKFGLIPKTSKLKAVDVFDDELLKTAFKEIQ